MPVRQAHRARQHLAVAARTEHDVVTGAERLDEAVQHREVVRAVTVREHEVLSTRLFHTTQARRAVTTDRLAHHARARALRLTNRIVRRAVVAYDNFAGVPTAGEDAVGFTHAVGDRARLVPARHDDRHLRCRILHYYRPRHAHAGT